MLDLNKNLQTPPYVLYIVVWVYDTTLKSDTLLPILEKTTAFIFKQGRVSTFVQNAGNH